MQKHYMRPPATPRRSVRTGHRTDLTIPGKANRNEGNDEQRWYLRLWQRYLDAASAGFSWQWRYSIGRESGQKYLAKSEEP